MVFPSEIIFKIYLQNRHNDATFFIIHLGGLTALINSNFYCGYRKISGKDEKRVAPKEDVRYNYSVKIRVKTR